MRNPLRLLLMRNHFLLLLLFSFSCRNEKKPYILAFLQKWIDERDTLYTKEVYIYKENGFALIPKAEINDTPLPITDFSYHWYLYSEGKKFLPGKRYEMLITHDAGTATAEILFPGDFSILKPDDNFILHKDSSLQIIWERAKYANSYLLSAYVSYSYIDTNGNSRSFSFSQDTIITDTTLFYPKEILFPGDLRQINWGEGRIEIKAIDGSIIWPGVKENIKGMGHGFFYGINHSGERYFTIAGRAKNRK